ncbi:exodeoxyribonuclease VII large subunit [Candidatus Kapaibacterium sp.]
MTINDAVSVSILTNRIRSVLETDFTNIMVTGEISNYKLHSSGHSYFSLKDDKAQIKCVLWRGRTLNFKPTDGMKVVARGSVTVYPPQGNYQLDCYELTKSGEGDLWLAYEELKQKLSSLGYFETSRKRPIPKIPLSIGISTSPTGAAVQDMISTLKRRLPLTKVYFRPTLVQGEGSADDIARAIQELNRTDAELIIVGRGGGSIEDLWSYNTEIVADAIFKSSVPVISAVGHETDFTIADFVSDLRAPTPTAAAELASQISFTELIEFANFSNSAMCKSINKIINQKKSGAIERFDKIAYRRITEQIRKNYQIIDSLEISLNNYIKSKLSILNQKVSHFESHFKSLHPLAPFEKGFAALKYDGKYIGNDLSLTEFNEVQIIRKKENINVKILKDNK